MDILPYVIIAIVGIVSGILSGIGGGGGSMLMIPAFIFTGLPPQMAVATAKMSGLGAAFGGLSAFAKSGHVRKDVLRVMIPIAIVIGLVTPIIFSVLESRSFQIALAVIMIILLPTLFIKKKALNTPAKMHKYFGYSLYTIILFIQGIFSSGVGSLALFVLTLLLGLSKIEAMATRRAVMAVMGPISFVALLVAGFVDIGLGLVGLLTVLVGTNIGSRIALKRSDMFISTAMAVTIFIASIVLIVSA